MPSHKAGGQALIVAGLTNDALARLTQPGEQRPGITATPLLGLVASITGDTIASLLNTSDIWD